MLSFILATCQPYSIWECLYGSIIYVTPFLCIWSSSIEMHLSRWLSLRSELQYHIWAQPDCIGRSQLEITLLKPCCWKVQWDKRVRVEQKRTLGGHLSSNHIPSYSHGVDYVKNIFTYQHLYRFPHRHRIRHNMAHNGCCYYCTVYCCKLSLMMGLEQVHLLRYFRHWEQIK